LNLFGRQPVQAGWVINSCFIWDAEPAADSKPPTVDPPPLQRRLNRGDGPAVVQSGPPGRRTAETGAESTPTIRKATFSLLIS
jgi:hypothetical protein